MYAPARRPGRICTGCIFQKDPGCDFERHLGIPNPERRSPVDLCHRALRNRGIPLNDLLAYQWQRDTSHSTLED